MDWAVHSNNGFFMISPTDSATPKNRTCRKLRNLRTRYCKVLLRTDVLRLRLVLTKASAASWFRRHLVRVHQGANTLLHEAT